MSTPTPGRRVAARARRGPDAATLASGLVVTLAGLLLVTGAVVSPEAERPRTASAVAVDEVAVACARSLEPGTTRAFTLAAPLPEADEPTGTLAAGPVGGHAPASPAAARGVLQELDVPGTDQPQDTGSAFGVVAAEGAAFGRGTVQVDRGRPDTLAAQDCGSPRARWWFTGAGAGLDHTSVLVLANLDPGPAVVDVLVHDDAGPVDSVGTRGLTVPAGQVLTLDLRDVAPQADELGVHVEASRGRVVAALADRFADGPGTEPGREWLPAQAEASRVVRLGPLPRRADRRTLVVANPADREALVEVGISTAGGTFAPTGLTQLRVPAGSVVTADLGAAVGRETVAVLLRSPVPVTATVRSTLGSDVSYAGAAPQLSGPAVAVLPDGLSGTLQLTAAEQGGTARVTAYSAGGKELAAAELQVDPAATLTWAPPARAGYLLVSPGEGRLFGGVTLAGEAGLSQVVLHPLPTTRRRPAVLPVVR